VENITSQWGGIRSNKKPNAEKNILTQRGELIGKYNISEGNKNEYTILVLRLCEMRPFEDQRHYGMTTLYSALANQSVWQELK
jgi:hypothetical protein